MMAEKTAHPFAKPQPVTGPVVHRVVLWNVRPGTTEEQIATINVKGRELLLQIPGVVEMRGGVAMEADAPYRYYALLTLSSPEIVEVFNQHWLHAQFGELYFNPFISDHYVADYVIQT
jgi:hypothetical protein